MIRTVLIDDHPLVRLGLRTALVDDERFEVCGDCGDGESGLALIADTSPDLVVVDLSLPDFNGFEVVGRARETGFRGKLVFMSVHDDRAYRDRGRQVGASGWISKETPVPAVLEALARVATEREYIEVPDAIADRPALPATVWRGLDELTEAERKVLALVAENMTSREIATALHVSVRTVQNHRTHICSKLGLTGSNRLLEVSLRLAPVLKGAAP